MVVTYQALTCAGWQHPQQHDTQGKPGNVEQPGEDLDDNVNPHRKPAWDDTQEYGPEREQYHEGDGRYDPVGGAAPHRRVVVEASPVPKPEAAAAVATTAIATTAAAAGARVPAARISAAEAAASPAAELGESWVGERGWWASC